MYAHEIIVENYMQALLKAALLLGIRYNKLRKKE